MDITIVTILSVLVGILAIIQGWQVIAARKARSNHDASTDDCLSPEQMNMLTSKLGEISQKVDDIKSGYEQLRAELHNGYTCRSHAAMEKDIGWIKGKLDK